MVAVMMLRIVGLQSGISRILLSRWRYVFVFYVTLNKSFSTGESVHLLPTSQRDLATGWTPSSGSAPTYFHLHVAISSYFVVLFASSLDRLYIYSLPSDTSSPVALKTHSAPKNTHCLHRVCTS